MLIFKWWHPPYCRSQHCRAHHGAAKPDFQPHPKRTEPTNSCKPCTGSTLVECRRLAYPGIRLYPGRLLTKQRARRVAGLRGMEGYRFVRQSFLLLFNLPQRTFPPLGESNQVEFQTNKPSTNLSPECIRVRCRAKPMSQLD
jgi:hypothetical protein